MQKIFVSFILCLTLCSIMAGCIEIKQKSEYEITIMPSFNFTAKNETNGCTATAGNPIVDVTTNVTINGETTSMRKKSNELIASEGDEVIVTFVREHGEKTAEFNFPDGTTTTLTATNDTYKWIVGPFKNGDKIKGETIYTSNDRNYPLTNEIILMHPEK